MKIRLNRFQIFMLGIFMILLYVFLYRVKFIRNSELTRGIVIDKKEVGGLRTGGGQIAPIIAFYYDGYQYRFPAELNLNIERGDIVDVIFNLDDPTEAMVYSFSGFWLAPLLYAIFPFILYVAAIYSFIKRGQQFVIPLWKERARTPISFREEKENKLLD